MPSTVKYRQGDIYIIEIRDDQQTVGSEQKKTRPFIIVSCSAINDSCPLIVGVPLTTNLEKASAHRIKIPVGEITRDSEYHGKIEDSVALTDQVRALDKSRIRGKVGHLSTSAVAGVGLGLAYVLDLQ